MEKLVAYKMSVAEAEEGLQCWLDNSGLRLIREYDAYFSAVSSSQRLDGAELDERFAELLGVRECENHIADDGDVLIVVTKEGAANA